MRLPVGYGYVLQQGELANRFMVHRTLHVELQESTYLSGPKQIQDQGRVNQLLKRVVRGVKGLTRGPCCPYVVFAR